MCHYLSLVVMSRVIKGTCTRVGHNIWRPPHANMSKQADIPVCYDSMAVTIAGVISAERVSSLGGEPTTQPEPFKIGKTLKEILEIDTSSSRIRHIFGTFSIAV